MSFTGEYPHTIDAKQRLAIPAEIRSKLNPEVHGEGFYLSPGANGFLWLWPERTFERRSAELEQSLLPGQELMEFQEALYPFTRHLELDKAGRVRIPEETLREYGLGASVVILGMKDHLELRDPEQWKAQRPLISAKRVEINQRARPALQRSLQGGQKEGP